MILIASFWLYNNHLKQNCSAFFRKLEQNYQSKTLSFLTALWDQLKQPHWKFYEIIEKYFFLHFTHQNWMKKRNV